MKMKFFPYELKLKHVFTVASFSRTTTPDVQVEIEYEGVTGYGEASMPPYLGQTVDSVMTFLSKVDLEQFNDPFELEDILAYVDSLSPGDTAAKAAVDIALHDLVGKLLGAPWYKIWGLNKEKTPSTTFTIGIDSYRERTNRANCPNHLLIIFTSQFYLQYIKLSGHLKCLFTFYIRCINPNSKRSRRCPLQNVTG